MLDFHSHILPGIDDGAPDLETAIEMARIAVADGITTMVATPHFIEGSMENYKDDILQATESFCEVLKKEDIPLNVLPGSEIYVCPQIPTLLKQGQLMTVNNGGKYLLIELPMQTIPNYLDDVLFEIKLQGVTPIIAHPERNIGLIAKPERVLNLAQKGCLLQLNAGSFIGFYGEKVKKTSEILARNGLIHLMGSDAHSAGGRAPKMREALMKASKLELRNQERINFYSNEVIKGNLVNPELPHKLIIQRDSFSKIIGKIRGLIATSIVG